MLQETFLAALDGLEGFDEHRPLGPYLVGILRNMVRVGTRREEGRTMSHRRTISLVTLSGLLGLGACGSTIRRMVCA